MKNESQTEALGQKEILDVELNNVIDANKDLYDKLNEYFQSNTGIMNLWIPVFY